MSLSKLYNSEIFRTQGHQLIDLLAEHLSNIENSSSAKAIQWKEPNEEYEYWKNFAGDQAQDFFAQVLSRSIHVHHQNYMGHQVAVPAPISALNSLLSGFLNNGMAVYEMGAASTAIERICIEFICKHLGYDQTSSGFLTSGGTLANLTALLSARAKMQPEIWNKGHQNKALAIMVSEQAHYCIDRAARIMGLGEKGIIKIPVNDRFQLDPALLESYYQRAIDQGLEVIAIVGSACSTSTGSYDDLNAIGSFAERHQIWFHVDGAHGAAVCFSNEFKHLIQGINRADSITLDCHKMMMTSSVTTALLFKNKKDSYRTFNQEAEYLWSEQASEDWFNLGKRTFECTKLMMSIQFYGIIQLFGESVLEEYIDTVHQNAKDFAELIIENDQMELAMQPQSNIVCFRVFRDNYSNEKLNQLNTNIRRKLLDDSTFYIVQTILKGKVFLRATLMNPFTKKDDLEKLLGAIVQLI